MKIQVTSEDINNGRESHCSECPVALACRRVFPNNVVKVTRQTIHLYEINGSEPSGIINLPIVASYFIYDFDEGRTVDPFEFEINL